MAGSMLGLFLLRRVGSRDDRIIATEATLRALDDNGGCHLIMLLHGLTVGMRRSKLVTAAAILLSPFHRVPVRWTARFRRRQCVSFEIISDLVFGPHLVLSQPGRGLSRVIIIVVAVHRYTRFRHIIFDICSYVSIVDYLLSVGSILRRNLLFISQGEVGRRNPL